MIPSSLIKSQLCYPLLLREILPYLNCLHSLDLFQYVHISLLQRSPTSAKSNHSSNKFGKKKNYLNLGNLQQGWISTGAWDYLWESSSSLPSLLDCISKFYPIQKCQVIGPTFLQK